MNEPSDRKPRHDGDYSAELLVGAVSVALNVLVNGVLPKRWHIPASLGAAAVVAVCTRNAGVSWAEQGLDPRRVPRGVRGGALAAVPIAGVLVAGLFVRPVRRFYWDQRIVQRGPAGTAYEALVRVPFGTAVPEEVIFRGSLLALFSRRHGTWAAAALSSALFGLWHIAPTIDSLGANPGAAGMATHPVKRAAAVASVVAGTAIGGLGFAWLERKTGSVVAPAIAHTTANAAGLGGGWLASRVFGGEQADARTELASSGAARG